MGSMGTVGIDERVLARLAIFPLPDVVLFPGTVLPLHVFEPRYVDMTRDVVAGTRHFAIARLRPGYQADYLGRPPIYPVAGLGEVIACQELPGDRFAIAVRGGRNSEAAICSSIALNQARASGSSANSV